MTIHRLAAKPETDCWGIFDAQTPAVLTIDSGDTVVVENPGGTLEVTFHGDRIRLRGPVRKVADIEVDRAEILEAAAP